MKREPEFSPSARFFLDEDGDPVVMDGGKFWVLGPKGARDVPGVPLLTSEEPSVVSVSKEEAFAAIRAS